MDCQTAMGVLAVGILCASLMITIVLHYVLHKYTAPNDFYIIDDDIFKSNQLKQQTTHLRLEENLIHLCGNYGKVFFFYDIKYLIQNIF